MFFRLERVDLNQMNTEICKRVFCRFGQAVKSNEISEGAYDGRREGTEARISAALGCVPE